MAPPLLPQPLHSILLVVKTRSGPRLVLHYPPSPDEAARSRLHGFAHQASEQAHDASSGYDDSQDELNAGRLDSYSRLLPNTPAFSSTLDSDSHQNEDDSGLEFGSASADSMARLLTPSSRGWDGKRFELTLEDRTYLACPNFERSDGGWKSKRARSGTRNSEDKRATKRASASRSGSGGLGLDGADSDAEQEEEEADPGPTESTARQCPTAEGNDEEDDNSTSPVKLALDDGSATEDDGTSKALADTGVTGSIRIPERPKQERTTASSSLVPASFATTGTSGSMPSQSSSIEAQVPQTLSMFSLVFVIEPDGQPELEERISDIYTNVLKILTKALKMTQKKNGWLWNQCRTIVGVREKGRDQGVSYKSIWPSIAAKSGLARSLASAYESISTGGIAYLQLGSSRSPMPVTLQIPQAATTPSAPTPMSLQRTGLWTSTYDPVQTNAFGRADDSGALSRHTAILLLKPAAELIKDLTSIAGGGTERDLLVKFAQHLTPTKTLLQLSRKTRISLPSIQRMSAHLIHWRRAIAIPPLHASHTYVVNPNADFSRLDEASKIYAKRFPLLPGLPIMLSKLSGHTTGRANAGSKRPTGQHTYGSFIPSSDHKIPYMEVLEWLMRDGWLMQLQTFAWVRISANIKAAVARQIRDETRKAELEAQAESDLDHSGTAAVTSDDETGFAEDQVTRTDRKRSSGGSVAVPAQSPRLRALLRPPKPASDAGSSSSAKTTVRISSGLRVPRQAKNRGRGSPGARHSNHSPRLSDGSSQSKSQVLSSIGDLNDSLSSRDMEPAGDDDTDIRPEDFEPSLVLSPHRASALESRWLKRVGELLPTIELRETWPKIVKYFDGRHALEEIALREGWKRKVANPMLAALVNEDNGAVLRVVQHW